MIKNSEYRYQYKKTNLNNSHGQSGLSGELLTNVSSWLGCFAEGGFENFELFGLDGRARAAPFVASFVVVHLRAINIKLL